MKYQLNSLLAAGAVVAGVLLSATVTQAATVEKDGDVATAIRDLTVGSNTYDVTFPVTSPAETYEDPPTFDTNTSAQAKTATEAVVAVLNAEGDIMGVGVSADDGRPIFRVPWAIRDILIPFVDIEVECLLVWEGVTGDTSSPGVWGVPSDSDQFPFFDPGAFAKFTLVSTGGSGNSPPAADAGGPYEGAVDVAVEFDGSGSSDWDGSIINRKWDFGDGSTGKGKKVEHVYTAAGTYNVIHTVTDDAGAKGSESTTANIGADGAPPVADAGGPYEGSVSVAVQFDGSGSADSDGTIEEYKWIFGDGSMAAGANKRKPEHTYEDSGEYTVTLKVTNDLGETNTDTTTAEIGEGNRAPVADAGGPYGGTVGENVDFDGSGSNDPDGKIQSYKWDLGDGESEKGETPDHKYEEPGTYTVTLRVTDNDSAKASDETTVVILE